MDRAELELKKAEFFANISFNLILERDKTIIFIIQLFIALFVIASFNENIISPSYLSTIRTLLSVLLFITPIMISDYIMRISNGIESTRKAAGLKNENRPWYINLFNGSIYVYVIFIISVIDAVAYMILHNRLASMFAIFAQISIIIIIMFLSDKELTNNNSIIEEHKL